MPRHRAKCCCGECVPTGAMCIIYDTQDFARGCYENVTAAMAEEEGGIFLGIGTDCNNVSGSGCPDCSDSGSEGFVSKKCCYRKRYPTNNCNEWVEHPCEPFESASLTQCECEMLMGDWGVDQCECVGDNPDCQGMCCPPANLPAGSTGYIQVIIGITISETYTFYWGCTQSGGDCYGDAKNEYYMEQPVYMNANEYSNYVAHYQDADYHDICTGGECGQACVSQFDNYRTTQIVRVYKSNCQCGDDLPDHPCSPSCFCLWHTYQSLDGIIGANCQTGHWHSGGEGYLCCDDTPQGS